MAPTLHLYAADEPPRARTPAVTHASISGSGSPGTDEFYRKKALIGDVAGRFREDPGPAVIEIQYWYPEGLAPVEIADFYSVNPVPQLHYRVLAVVPGGTTTVELEAGRVRATSAAERAGDAVELFEKPEQEVVQVMHHGSFAGEFATLARLGAFARDGGLRRSGPHHEVHLDGFTRDTRRMRSARSCGTRKLGKARVHNPFGASAQSAI